MKSLDRLLLAACFLIVLAVPSAQAQDLSPRFGVGLGGTLSTENGFGLSLFGRASAPINADFSLGVDLGATGYVLGGREDAVYIFTPQLSAIVSLPSDQPDRLPYILAGLGAHVPLTHADRSITGPTIHVGLGRVRALRETSLFYEIDPALVIGEEHVELIVPFRIGLIF